MMKMKGAKAMISYILVGILLIILSQVIEPITGFNPTLRKEFDLKKLLWFIGALLALIAATFAFLMMISSKKPSQEQVERFEKHELLLHKITLFGNVVCIAGFAIAAFLPSDHPYNRWMVWLGYGGIYIMAAPGLIQMRALIYAQFEPSLMDERYQELFAKGTMDGFHWMSQTAMFGVAIHLLFNLDIPVWFAFVGPLLMGYLGRNWSLVKALRAEEIQHE